MRKLYGLIEGLVAASALSASVACAPPVVLAPDTTKPGVAVLAEPVAAGGLVTPGSWQGGGLSVAADASDCPHHQEELERALDLRSADACPIVREQPPTEVGDGDAELPPSIAPHCYELGASILVVQYLKVKTSCTKVVGLAVLPRRPRSGK